MAAPATVHAGQIQAWLKEHPGRSHLEAIAALTQPATPPLEHEGRVSLPDSPDHLSRLRAALDVAIPTDGLGEKGVQREIEIALEGRGIRQPKHWRGRRLTPKLGQGFYYRTTQARRSKVSDGLPDLVVSIVGYPWAILFEVKGRAGFEVSPDQRIAAEAGTVWIVRSAAQALRLLDAIVSMFPSQLNTTAAMERQLA